MNTIIPLMLDLILEFLLRLPVKSLLRFRSVCKEWCDITKSLSFIQTHFNHESNQDSLLVYCLGDPLVEDGEDFVIDDDVDFVYGFAMYTGQILEQYEEPDHLQLPGDISTISDPCNGVVCIVSMSHKLALWNPATRKMRPLPSPREIHVSFLIGFGVDTITDEFKILLHHGDSSRYLSIYTSSNDSWRCCDNEPLLTEGTLYPKFVYWKGFIYCKKYNMRTAAAVIIAFDMHNEVFQEIAMPNGVLHDHLPEFPLNIDRNIKIYEGSINVSAIAERHVLGLFEDSLALFCVYEINRVDIWVMKEQGCWICSYSLRVPFSFDSVAGSWKGKNLILIKLDEAEETEELALYNPDSGNTQIVKFPCIEETHGREISVFNYKKSLYPVKGQDEIQDYEIDSAASHEFFS